MLIVTTIYCMEVEATKKVPAQKPTQEETDPDARADGREFLGIYQGRQETRNRD